MQKRKLADYLASFATENKLSLIDAVLAERTRYVTVALEDVYQPHNASAVLRSCDIFGVQDVQVVEKKYKLSVNTAVSRGAGKWLTIHKHTQTEAAIEALKKDGYRIIATTPHKKAQPIDELSIDHKIALFFGTEESGLSPAALELADAFTIIPMYGFTQSFNVSVSVALCLQSIMNRLRASDIDWRINQEEMIDLKIEWLRKILPKGDRIVNHFLKTQTQ